MELFNSVEYSRYLSIHKFVDEPIKEWHLCVNTISNNNNINNPKISVII